MQPESVIIYERVLKGERWPIKYIGNETTKERSMEILRYLFFEKLKIIDYDTLKATLTTEFIEKYCIKRVISSFLKPVELLENEYDHILWLLFPDRIKGKKSMIIKVYKDVLNGRRPSFPRGYFTDPEEGKERARICFKYMCRKIMHLSGEQIAWEFCHSDGLKILAKYKLKILTSHVYGSLSDMVADVYPQYYDKLVEFQVQRDGRHKITTRKRCKKMTISNAFATHTGKVKEASGTINEDYAHAWVKDGIYYQAVADGNGSNDKLNPAPFIMNEVQRFIDSYSEPKMTPSEVKRMIKGALHSANRVLIAYKKALGEGNNVNSFTSLDITAVFKGDKLVSGHIGDTRSYLIREEKIHQLTKDHTEAQRLCDEGQICKEQIFTHPDRDVLTSVLGIDNPKIDIREGVVKEGDIILLLTDGAHKLMSPEQILQIVLSAGKCIDTCNGIVEGANMLGSPDNISVCVTYIPKKPMAE